MKRLLLATVPLLTVAALQAANPTAGLKEYTDTYKIQSPYNLPASARFSISSGPIYNTFILKGDKGFTSTTTTGPRTEMRWNTDWTKTEHFWQADVLIDSGTEGTCIAQTHATANAFEPIYVQVVSGGDLRNDNSSTHFATGMYGKWFTMVTSYDPTSGDGNVWINGNLVCTRHDPHPISTIWYFKNGVYGISGSKSSTHFKNIKFFTK